jgi:hypothetical protein
MKISALSTLFLVLSAGVANADHLITRQKHTDAAKVGPRDEPAEDSTEVTWLAKDRMRVEEGDKITIVRLDLKKIFVLDKQAKTVSTLEIPVVLEQYIPEESREIAAQLTSRTKAELKTTTETKKIKDWNATKVMLTVSMPAGGSAYDMWVTKDVAFDRAAWMELMIARYSMRIDGAATTAEMKKIDGYPVLVERRQQLQAVEQKSRDELVSIEEKEAPAGWYDAPKDYAEKPYNALGGMSSPRKSREKPAEKPVPPPDKPAPK